MQDLYVYANAETSPKDKATSPSCICTMKGTVCQGVGSLVAADTVRVCSGRQKTRALSVWISMHIRASEGNSAVSSLLPQGSNSGHEVHTASVSVCWGSSTAPCGSSQWFYQMCWVSDNCGTKPESITHSDAVTPFRFWPIYELTSLLISVISTWLS